jgi:hypothetical protein
MSAYQLWGAQSRCHLSELAALLHTSEDWLWGVMAYLDAEGLVSLDRSASTVALTSEGARNLMADTPPNGRVEPAKSPGDIGTPEDRRPPNGAPRS